MDTQQTIAAAEGDFLSANDELIQELAAFEAGETYFVRRGACSNLALVEQESSSSKGEAPRTLPVATPARAAAPVPDIQEISEVPEVPPTEASEVPQVAPTDQASEVTHVAPTDQASEVPHVAPTDQASEVPEVAPTDQASEIPEVAPTDQASEVPEVAPTDKASEVPEVAPTDKASEVPLETPAPDSCPESVSLEVASVSDAASPDLLSLKAGHPTFLKVSVGVQEFRFGSHETH